MKISFLGAAGEVTGSCFLVETPRARFLVDCGMFQGGREADMKNRNAFGARFGEVAPHSLDFVLLTHAHIDHSGLLPLLAARGFAGPVYATGATCDLLDVMLRDAAHIQEKEAEWANNRHGGAAAPLYTMAQAEAALARLRPVSYDGEFAPHPAVRCRFRDAGHILGSALIEARVDEVGAQQKLVFSGDLGQPGHPIVRDPAPVHDADVVLVESTYGNRLHKSMDETLAELVHAIGDTLTRKRGNVIVPAFTVGRTQDMLFLLADLYRQGRLPEMAIYVDSPMAASATAITLKHREVLDAEAASLMRWLQQHDGRPRIHFTQDVAESVALNRISGGAVIISASGMCDAGRIKHHLRHNLPRPECTVLITGFQAGGTLGRQLVDGAKTVRIFHEEIPVRADIYTIGGLSAHADQAGLLSWLSHFKHAPRRVFVVHGEQSVADGFAALLRERFGWNVAVPAYRESVML